MAAPGGGAVQGECRYCLAEGWYSTDPRAGAAAGGAQPQQRAPSVRPARAGPGGAGSPAPDPPGGCARGDPADRLIVPCMCRGTAEFTHRQCLLEWLRYASSRSRPMVCGACQFPFCVVARARGMFDSVAPQLVAFRCFLQMYALASAAAVAAGVCMIKIGPGPISVAACSLLSAPIFCAAIYLIRRVKTLIPEVVALIPAPVAGSPHPHRDLIISLLSLAVTYLGSYEFGAAMLLHTAVMLAVHAAQQCAPLYPDLGIDVATDLQQGSEWLKPDSTGLPDAVTDFGLGVLSSVASAAELCRVLLGALRSLFLVFAFIHFIGTRRAWLVQCLAQCLIFADAFNRVDHLWHYGAATVQEVPIIVDPTLPVVWLVLLTAALWVDKRAHPGEHGIVVLDVLEPQPAPPQQ